MSETEKSQQRLSHLSSAAIALLLFITAAGAIARNMVSPMQADDWVYMHMAETDDVPTGVLFWESHGPLVEDYGDVFESIVNHYRLINARLANFLHILFVPVDSSVEGVLMGICTVLMALMLALLGDYRGRLSPLAVLLAVLLMWTAFPWYDYMQSVVYQMNYVAPTLLCYLTIWYLRWLDTLGKWKLVGFMALTLLTGLMHEGFTAILLVYMVSLPLCRGLRPSRRYIAAVVVMATSLAYHLSSPILGRTAGTQIDIMSIASRSLVLTVPLFVAVILSLVDKRVSRLTMKDYTARYGAWLLAAFAGAAMPVVLMMANRTYWIMDVFCVPAIIIALTSLLERVPLRVKAAAALAAAVPYALWMAELVRWEKILGDEERSVQHHIMELPAGGLPYSGIIPFTTIPSDNIPSYLLGIPMQVQDDFLSTRFFASAAGHTHTVTLPVDTAYASKPLEEWPKIPGNNPLYGRWPYMAQRDSTTSVYNGVFGPPESSMPLFDRLLCHLMGRSGEVEYRFWWGAKTVPLADGDTIYRAFVLTNPRTIRHRKLIRIDTVPASELQRP